MQTMCAATFLEKKISSKLLSGSTVWTTKKARRFFVCASVGDMVAGNGHISENGFLSTSGRLLFCALETAWHWVILAASLQNLLFWRNKTKTRRTPQLWCQMECGCGLVTNMEEKSYLFDMPKSDRVQKRRTQSYQLRDNPWIGLAPTGFNRIDYHFAAASRTQGTPAAVVFTAGRSKLLIGRELR